MPTEIPAAAGLINGILAQLQRQTGADLSHYQGVAPAVTVYGADFWQAIAQLLTAAVDPQLVGVPTADEVRYRQLADAMPHLVWTANELGVVDYYNVRINDYDPAVRQGATGFEWQHFIHPADLPATAAAWQAATQRGDPYTHEHRLRMADGQWRWHLSRAVLVRTPNRAGKWYGTATDIHERKAVERNQQFLLDLDTQTRLLTAAETILATTAARLGHYLGVTHCAFTEIDRATDQCIVLTHWQASNEWHSLIGVHQLSTLLGPTMAATLAGGQHIIVHDALHDPQTVPFATRYAASGVHALACIPYRLQGAFLAMLTVAADQPRHWHEDEVALLENTMARVWPLVVKARTADALRESEAYFRTMADTAPAMLWTTNPEGYCTFLSRGWYEFTGQTAAEGLGYGWLNAAHPADQERARQIFLTANATQVSFSFDYRLRHVDGSYRWAIDAGRPHFSDEGKFLGYIGSIIDINARKLVEEQLRSSEERYRYLFEAMDEGFCVIEMLFDAHGQPVDYRFLELNPAFERFTGLYQAAGRTALELVPNLEAHWIETYGKIALTGEPVRFEQGSAAMGRWFDVYAFRVGEPTSHRVAILFKDISENKAAAEQLQHLNATLEQRVHERTAQLERSNRELDQFAYVASHDLKAPLRSIEHLANWITDDAASVLPQTSYVHLTKLRERVQRMERLLDDLLAYSRVGRRDGPAQLVNTALLVKDTIALLAPPPGFRIEITGELPELITPRVPLEVVIRNLIGNALKHHHDPAQGEVYISARELGDFIEFGVDDNGPGIDPQYHERIFGVFQTLQPRDQVEGSGMGLALVKKTVEYRGGTVRIKSASGAGTTFYFTWPKVCPNYE